MADCHDELTCAGTQSYPDPTEHKYYVQLINPASAELHMAESDVITVKWDATVSLTADEDLPANVGDKVTLRAKATDVGLDHFTLQIVDETGRAVYFDLCRIVMRSVGKWVWASVPRT